LQHLPRRRRSLEADSARRTPLNQSATLPNNPDVAEKQTRPHSSHPPFLRGESMPAALANPSALAIDLTDVAKTYKGRRGGVQALRGITMQVYPGEIFGLLGPNGAGKSTLVKILMTVISPTRCKGTMLGRPVGHKETLARVGYLPEHHRFPEYLTGAQVLDFYAALAKVRRSERRKRAGELLELVGMSGWGAKKVKSYSKGMRQRIGIAQALMNEPDLIILDEPTDGVDPVGRRDIRNVLTELKSRGKTVFLNSHLLSELEMVCDRVAILVQGLVSSQGTIDELTERDKHYSIELAMPELQSTPEEIRALLPDTLVRPASQLTEGSSTPLTSTALARRIGYRAELASGQWIEIEKNHIRIGGDDALSIQPVIDALRERNAVIRAIRPQRPSLEDLFMRAVTDPNTGEVLAPGAAPTRKGARP
jgi:ABC-2 type transport system ATP-binding protein